MNYLTVGSVIKNEDSYIEDFVKIHKHLGVEKFIFLDREFNKINELFQHDPDVTVVHFPEGNGNVHQQGWAQLIGMTQATTKWLACIDADQVLFPTHTRDIKEVLRNYEQFASLQVNWHTFGSGGQKERLPGSVYERFITRAPNEYGENAHTQFVCQPARALPLRSHDPHHCQLPAHEVSVNTNKQKVSGPFNRPPLHDVLWIAHYINKSWEEYQIKSSKGRADIFGQIAPVSDWSVRESGEINSVTDLTIKEFWDSIKG